MSGGCESEFELWYKPGWDAVAIEAVRGKVVRTSSIGLRLAYIVEGRIDELVVPEVGPPMRQHGLWKTTCFEIFLKPRGGEAYVELNFSPSGAWAAYDFDAYRAGMVEAAVIAAPEIAASRVENRLELDIAFALDLREPGYEMGIGAVMEERGGAKSYWALNHPAGPPDFHHPACFALELPPAA